MAVDSDGIGPHHGDRTAQDETTYKPNLNADVDLYVVVPPLIVRSVAPIVMGCKALCVNICNGKTAYGLVGDIGPRIKLGEASCAMAEAMGLSPSPVSGGTDEHIIGYRIWPGIAAPGYHLQPA